MFASAGLGAAGLVVARVVESHGAIAPPMPAAAAAGETPELNTVDQALTVQRVIDAIYRSAETRRNVSVADAD